MNENIQHEFFIWEEKSSIDQSQNLLKNANQDKCVTTTETNQNVENLHWKDITDVKLRRKMKKKEHDKRYTEKNKDKVKLRQRLYREKNKDKIQIEKKTYYRKNKDKIRVQQKSWISLNKEKKKLQSKSWRVLNKDKIKIQKKVYAKNNRNKINKYFDKKRKTDIQFKLGILLRSRLREALKGNFKSGSAVKDLGCSINELKTYLESKFLSGMSWENHGIYGWHIDHIKPLSSFNLNDRKQMLEACHYTNLQPLWAKDNLSKSDKIV